VEFIKNVKHPIIYSQFLKEEFKRKLQDLQFDEIRTHEWWEKAFKYLEKVNPNRYKMTMNSMMDGLEVFYQLWDNYEIEKIGPTLIYSIKTKEWRHVS